VRTGRRSPAPWRAERLTADDLVALSDSGVPTYDENLAKRRRNRGIPCCGGTPGRLPEFLTGARIRSFDRVLSKPHIARSSSQELCRQR
jgi:hypothetical protein